MWINSYFILDTKHLCFTPVQVGLLESAWRGLDWQGRKATISDLQDIKTLQQCILIDSLFCQRWKPRVLQGFIKTHCPQGKHGGKRCIWTQHILVYVHAHICVHTCTHSAAPTDTLTVSAHVIHSPSDWNFSKCSSCFIAPGTQNTCHLLGW